MNVATFALRVSHAIGIDAATANSATSQEYTLFLSWLNEGVIQFLRKTKVYKRTASMALTEGQGDYAIDSDILAFEDVSYTPADGVPRMLQQIDTWQIRDMRILSDSSMDPEFYAYEGQTIMLYPTPRSSDDDFHIVYVPRPAALAATGDNPSGGSYGGIPEEYHTVIEAYVKWKAGEHANDKASGNGQAWKQEFEQGCVEVRVAEQRKGGMVIGSVNVGRRNWRRYAGPGVDIGG